MSHRLARRASTLVLLFATVALVSCSDKARPVVSVPDGASDSSPACPVTSPPSPAFVPPVRAEHSSGSFWYGSAELWTQLKVEGRGDPLRAGDKMFLWSEGFDWRAEPQPALVVSGRRLDGPAGPFVSTRATHALIGDDSWAAMLVGVSVPAAGCWEITGAYKGTALTFVVFVGP